MQRNSFLKTVCNLAVPVALQSMLQASFGIVDQIMIGQLGSVSVAGVGLAGKFSSIYTVVVSAIGAVAGIMISQYMGQENKKEIRRSFYLNLVIALALAGGFTAICLAVPEKIMGIYTEDESTMKAAASYLTITAATYLPIAGATLLSTMFRCLEKASLPLYASIAAALLNTGLNYVLIFGKFGLPVMGADGAAVATVVSQLANFLVMFAMIFRYADLLGVDEKRQCANTVTDKCTAKLIPDGVGKSEEMKQNKKFREQNDCSDTFGESGNRKQDKKPSAETSASRFNWNQYLSMLLPILVCEFLWSLGENVYAVIYGRLGTQACAAMTLINPIQSLMIGALCGLSQAAGVIIGKRLGNEEYDEAYWSAKQLVLYGAVGAAVLAVLIILTRGIYVEIYQVEDAVKTLTKQILVAYALVAPFKVLNMILGGGVIRSGGKTKYVMVIDMIGTWGFGVPFGMITAFVLKLSIPYVYFILSLEECIRFIISVFVFRSKKWMQKLEAE